MRTVDLSLPFGNQDQYFDLKFRIDISLEKLAILKKYNTHMTRIRATAILKKGMGGFKRLSLSDERGLEIRATDWSDAELNEFLHVVRLVTLEKEPASYAKAKEILNNHFPFENVQNFIARCHQAYEHGAMSMYMQVTVDEQRLFDSSILRLWLNGTQYHADTKKEAEREQIEAAISIPSARALVISQLHSKTLALLNLDYLAAQVLSGQEC
jgi:hypothetical protein